MRVAKAETTKATKKSPSKTSRKGALPEVVFLHGLGGSSADWGKLLEKLDGRYRTVVPELPGSSLAPARFASYRLDALAAWLADALAREGVGRAHLVAHSFGGRLAGELVARAPDRFASLLLVAPLGAAGYSLIDRLKWKAMSRTTILRSVPEAQMRRALSYGFVVDGPGKAGFVERALAARTGPQGALTAEAIERCVDGVLESPPLTDRLRTSTLPLGVVTGGKDPLVPSGEAEEIAKARKDVQLFKLPGQGHYPMLDDPKGMARLVERFLDSIA